MHVFESQRLFVQLGGVAHAAEAPGGGIAVVLIVAESFAIGRLVFLAEVAASGFVALQGIQAHQLGELEEVGHAAGLFERLV